MILETFLAFLPHSKECQIKRQNFKTSPLINVCNRERVTVSLVSIKAGPYDYLAERLFPSISVK